MLADLPRPLSPGVERGLLWLRRRKRPALATFIIVIVAALAWAFVTRSDRPVALFEAPLHPAQSAEVRQALTLWNEPFSADGQGSQIFVPAARRRDVLTQLALAGLPHAYVPTMADVLATNENPLTPEAIVDDRRRAGIEGDLVAGLRRIRGVADASVVIAPASSDPFGDERLRAPPSASVQLITQPDAQLSAATIAGVQRFVAAAYPMLAPDRVTVVDGTGAVLGAAEHAGADRAEVKERRVQFAVQSALDAVLGPGTAVVRASARSAGIAESTQTTRVVPHGLLDADVGRERGTDAGKRFEKERASRHYAYDTVVAKSSKNPDAVTRLSVAVFLDSQRVEASRTVAIEALVRAAAGADLRAGDEIVVERVPFAARRPVETDVTAERRTVAGRLVPFIWAGALGAVLLLVLGALTLRWRRAKHAKLPPEVRILRATVDQELPRTAAYLLRGLPAPVRDRVLKSYEPDRRAAVEAHLLGASDEWT